MPEKKWSLKGKGVSVAVVDSFPDDYPQAHLVKQNGILEENGFDFSQLGWLSHGNMVALTIAGGVARTTESLPNTGIASHAKLWTYKLRNSKRRLAHLEALDKIAETKADVLSLSQQIDKNKPHSIQQLRTIIDEGTILVWAAGNSHLDTASRPIDGYSLKPKILQYFAAKSSDDEHYEDGIILAAALGPMQKSGNTIQPNEGSLFKLHKLSNYPGIGDTEYNEYLKSIFVSAPGWDKYISVAEYNPSGVGLELLAHTSVAAPQVAGLLALMIEHFNKLWQEKVGPIPTDSDKSYIAYRKYRRHVVVTAFKDTAIKIDPYSQKALPPEYFGQGVPDLPKALVRVADEFHAHSKKQMIENMERYLR